MSKAFKRRNGKYTACSYNLSNENGNRKRIAVVIILSATSTFMSPRFENRPGANRLRDYPHADRSMNGHNFRQGWIWDGLSVKYVTTWCNKRPCIIPPVVNTRLYSVL